MRAAVIDSSSLIGLTLLGLGMKLALFFDVVYVPSSVHREVCKKHQFRFRLRKLYSTGIFQKCRSADTVRMDLLKVETDLGKGEIEALVQAQERYVRVFIGDEKRARAISENQGMKAVGVIRILARLDLDEQSANLWPCVRRLRKELGFRVTDEIVATAILSAAEPI